VFFTLREAAKKSSSLNGRASKALSDKIAGNGYWQFFFAPNFWTKIALFFGKYCNSPDKIPTYRQTLT